VVVPPLVALLMVVPPSFFLRIKGLSSLHTLLEVCSAHKDKVQIKCMGSIGRKTPTEPEIYSFFSILRHDKIDVVYNVPL
jgi:hypothetical protein